MSVNNQRATPGIRSALDVPVTHGNKKGESALFRGVAKRNGIPVPMESAAFCSRQEDATVVIGVSLSCLFGLSSLFGLSGLSGFLVERNQPDEPYQPLHPAGLACRCSFLQPARVPGDGYETDSNSGACAID